MMFGLAREHQAGNCKTFWFYFQNKKCVSSRLERPELSSAAFILSNSSTWWLVAWLTLFTRLKFFFFLCFWIGWLEKLGHSVGSVWKGSFTQGSPSMGESWCKFLIDLYGQTFIISDAQERFFFLPSLKIQRIKIVWELDFFVLLETACSKWKVSGFRSAGALIETEAALVCVWQHIPVGKHTPARLSSQVLGLAPDERAPWSAPLHLVEQTACFQATVLYPPPRG